MKKLSLAGTSLLGWTFRQREKRSAAGDVKITDGKRALVALVIARDLREN